jgi:hypothetical protein
MDIDDFLSCPTVFKYQFKISQGVLTYWILSSEKEEKDAPPDIKALFPNGQHHPNKQKHRGPLLLPKQPNNIPIYQLNTIQYSFTHSLLPVLLFTVELHFL